MTPVEGPVPPSRNNSGSRWQKVFCLGALVLIAFYPSFKIPFLLDDYQVYLNYWPQVSWGAMKEDVLGHLQQNRLLTHVSWYVQMILASPDAPSPFAFHVFNLLLHGLNVWLVYTLIRTYGSSGLAATMAAAVFAVHPANQEAVSYIYGRSDLQVTALMLGALILLKSGGRRMVFAAVCLLAAVWTKETVVVIPALYLLLTRVLRPEGVRVRTAAVALTVLASAGALAGFLFLKTDHADNFGYGFEDSMRYLMLQPFLLFVGLIRLIVPVGFTISYQFALPSGAADLRVIGTSAFWIAAIVFAFRQWKQGRRVPLFALGWYLVSMSPTNSIVPRIDQISDRHMYLSLIGPMWALVEFLKFTWERWGSWARRICWAMVIVFGALTFAQNMRWQSAIYIWKEAVYRFPNWPVARRELAAEYGRSGQSEKEMQILESTTRKWPVDWMSWNNLGIAYASDGRPAAAQKALERAIEFAPKRHRALLTHNLALAHQAQGQTDTAIALYREAIAADPDAFASKQNLAVLLWRNGKKDESERILNEILSVHPHYGPARQALAVIGGSGVKSIRK